MPDYTWVIGEEGVDLGTGLPVVRPLELNFSFGTIVFKIPRLAITVKAFKFTFGTIRMTVFRGISFTPAAFNFTFGTMGFKVDRVMKITPASFFIIPQGD